MIFYFLFCFFLLSNIQKVCAQLVANFSSNTTSGCAPLIVSFTDISTGNPTQWKWTLGNGTTATQQNPTTSYFFPGSYTVKLIIQNASGKDSIEKINNYFVGLAYHHFNRPKNSFYKNPEVELQPKIVFSSGVKFSLNETLYFTIHADYSQQGTYQELIGGALYSYKIGDDFDNPLYTLHLGAFLRASDAIIPIVKLDLHPISFAFSYDANISNLKTISQGRGGVEISLSYIGYFDKYQSSKFIPLCPKF